MSNNQYKIIMNMKKKHAYPHPVSSIKVLQTHVSWIFLTGLYAYKVKKEVKFGKILDFSKLYLRKKSCEKEVLLNRPLCDKMYQGVVKVVITEGILKFVNVGQQGKALEFAVKMLEMPQKCRMDNLLRVDKVNNRIVESLTEILVKFHNCATTSANIARFGRPIFMEKKIKENFKTLSKLTKIDSIYEEKLNSFVKNNERLFSHRIKKAKIRDIHGDLHLRNIFISNNKFYLYDRIEFNDSLRWADVAEDVAHLGMDLEFHHREDLQKHLISHYVRKSDDTTLMNIIYFMMCYKACVRAKVSLFRANQTSGMNSSINKNEVIEYENEAHEHFMLARKYMKLF